MRNDPGRGSKNRTGKKSGRGSWQGKTVLITGASRGIGFELAKLLWDRGASLALIARDERSLERVVSALGAAQGQKVVIAGADVSNRQEVAGAVAKFVAELDRIDYLINNAGIGLHSAVIDISPDDLRTVLETNLIGSLNCIQLVLPHMFRRHAGTIVNISSLASEVPAPKLGGYAASKAALNAISDIVRLEAAKFGIRVVTVYPGSTQTTFRESALGEPYSATDKRISRRRADEVARTVIRGLESGAERIYVSRSDALIAHLVKCTPSLAGRVLKRVFRHALRDPRDYDLRGYEER